MKINFNLKIKKILKRCLDLILSLILLLPTLFILVVLAIFIKLDSKGPVFFNAKRVGLNGKYYTCYKLRSMYINSEEILKKFLEENSEIRTDFYKFQKIKSENDPRITRVGRFIRKYSLDELPQIFNVIEGTMSLVGPRPYLLREEHLMGEYYDTIIKVKPGITGYWQVNGRSNVDFEGKLHMESWYATNWTIWLDIILLCKTFKVVFEKKGAY